MDNCFEACRLLSVPRVVYASSLAVNGMQKHYGDRMVTEDDFRHGNVQYAMHKIFNEWQAQGLSREIRHGDHRRASGQRHRPGQGARLGRSREHHHQAGARQADIVPAYKDAMRCPIHVDDIAEVFARVLMTDKPAHCRLQFRRRRDQPGRNRRYRARLSCRTRRSASRSETGGKDASGNYLIDNTRLVQEFGVQYRPYRESVCADHQRGPPPGGTSCDRRLNVASSVIAGEARQSRGSGTPRAGLLRFAAQSALAAAMPAPVARASQRALLTGRRPSLSTW